MKLPEKLVYRISLGWKIGLFILTLLFIWFAYRDYTDYGNLDTAAIFLVIILAQMLLLIYWLSYKVQIYHHAVERASIFGKKSMSFSEISHVQNLIGDGILGEITLFSTEDSKLSISGFVESPLLLYRFFNKYFRRSEIEDFKI